MKSARNGRVVVVETEMEFDQLLLQHAVEVELHSESEERAYEATDAALIVAIGAVLRELYGDDTEGKLYHQNEDWWPTRTRFLELDQTALQWSLIDRLQRLLKDDVADWRINVHAYAPLDSSPAVDAGSLNIYRDWILLDRLGADWLERGVKES